MYKVHGVLFQVQLIVALAVFLPFTILERQPYSTTLCVLPSSFEMHRVMKSPESFVPKHVLQGEVTYGLFSLTF